MDRNLPVFGFLAMRLEKRFEYIKTLYPSEDVTAYLDKTRITAFAGKGFSHQLF